MIEYRRGVVVEILQLHELFMIDDIGDNCLELRFMRSCNELWHQAGTNHEKVDMYSYEEHQQRGGDDHEQIAL